MNHQSSNHNNKNRTNNPDEKQHLVDDQRPGVQRVRSISVDDIFDPANGTLNKSDNNNNNNNSSFNHISDNHSVKTHSVHNSNKKKLQNQQGDSGNSNNIDQTSQYGDHSEILAGSMVFDDSHTSFEIDEGVELPRMDDNHRPNQTQNNDDDDGDFDSDSSSSSTSKASTEYTTSTDRRRALRKKQEGTSLSVGQKETIALRRTRSMLFLFIVVIALIGAITIWMITLHSEKVTFEHDFYKLGTQVQVHIETHFKQQLQALDTLATEVSIHVQHDSNTSWPFVTISPSAPILERYLQLLIAPVVNIFPIVPADLRKQWEEYSVGEQGWIDEDLQLTVIDSDKAETNSESRRLQADVNADDSNATNIFQKELSTSEEETTMTILPYIHDKNNVIESTTSEDPYYAVWWQYAPIVSDRSIINCNVMSSSIKSMLSASTPLAIMTPLQNYKEPKKKKKNSDFDDDNQSDASTNKTANEFIHHLLVKQNDAYLPNDPYFHIHYPIFDSLTNKTIVAIASATIYWKSYFEEALAESSGIRHGIICVINNTLGQIFTLDLQEGYVHLVGYGDYHDPDYEHLVVALNISSSSMEGNIFIDEDFEGYTGVQFNDNMTYLIHIYASYDLEEHYLGKTPIILACAALLCFVLTLAVFCCYDVIVTKRQKIVMSTAKQTYDMVSSLFPATVRDRLMKEANERNNNDQSVLGKSSHSLLYPQQNGSVNSNKAKTFDAATAIADFYPSASVLFSDITGFTAWCAEREPSQVFILLEHIFCAFDEIAKKRKVFKVETIGDCYMAAVGLPEPRDDHAVVICRFARQCILKLRGLLLDLEVILGPGTADLSMRFGIHSGPVTAGVLRSQNARFQLFGDTVNTAARMESNGAPGMVHISQETADELKTHGKSGWFYPRSERITAKGKGELQTFWLDLSAASIDDRMSLSTSSINTSLSWQNRNTQNDHRLKRNIGGKSVALADLQTCRLVDWILDTLNPMLCRIVSRRTFIESKNDKSKPSNGQSGFQMPYGPNIIDDMLATNPPTFDDTILDEKDVFDELPLETQVSDQLNDYVHMIASLYKNDNPYHNFEHTAHTIMSIVSFMNRIISVPKSSMLFEQTRDKMDTQTEQYYTNVNHVRNIFDDPITSFACILAALVHHLGHNGKPKEASSSVSLSSSSSHSHRLTTEQNAIQTAWTILIKPDFKLLRQAIFGNDNHTNNSDLNRFRFILVRAVLASDVDAHNRNEAIYHTMGSPLSSSSINNNKTGGVAATIDMSNASPTDHAISIIESIMQASDIVHMMQQWPIYMKWNERLLYEYVKVYNVAGMKLKRSSSMSSMATASAMNMTTASPVQQQHPSTYWYENELRYMELYVLPLTEKLRIELDFLSYQSVPSSIPTSINNNNNNNNSAISSAIKKNQKINNEFFVASTKIRNEWIARKSNIVEEMMSKYVQFSNENKNNNNNNQQNHHHHNSMTTATTARSIKSSASSKGNISRTSSTTSNSQKTNSKSSTTSKNKNYNNNHMNQYNDHRHQPQQQQQYNNADESETSNNIFFEHHTNNNNNNNNNNSMNLLLNDTTNNSSFNDIISNNNTPNNNNHNNNHNNMNHDDSIKTMLTSTSVHRNPYNDSFAFL